MWSLIQKRMKWKANTNWLDKNKQNINRKWRPRKLVKDVIEDLKKEGIQPVSMADIKDIYLSLVNTDQNTLKSLVAQTKTPVLIKIVAKAMVWWKWFEIIEKMFDRAIWKAVQQVEQTNKNIEITDTLTKEQKKKIAERLLKTK